MIFDFIISLMPVSERKTEGLLLLRVQTVTSAEVRSCTFVTLFCGRYLLPDPVVVCVISTRKL